MSTHKIVNISGEDRTVPWLGGRTVLADEVVQVDAEDLPAYLCQPDVWDAADSAAASAYQDSVSASQAEQAQAAQVEQEQRPAPFDPGPVPLALDSYVPEAEQTQELSARLAASREPVEAIATDALPQPTRTADAPTPAAPEPAAPSPQRTADAPTPQPLERPAPQAAPAPSAYGYRDLRNAPADDTVTGILAAVPPRPTL